MKLTRKGKPTGDIDITAFADIAFLLIIFFILTTTFTRLMGSRITIPSGTSDQEKKPEEKAPTVGLTRERILFNEDEMTLDQLRGKLMKMGLSSREEDQRIIILESAPDVRFERYYQVITAISSADGVLALVEHAEEAAEDKRK